MTALVTEVQPEFGCYYKRFIDALRKVENVLQTWCMDAQQWRMLATQHTTVPVDDLQVENESVWQKTVKTLRDCEAIGQDLFKRSKTTTLEMKYIAALYWSQQEHMYRGIERLMDIRIQFQLTSTDLQFLQVNGSGYDVDSAFLNAKDVAHGLIGFSATLPREELLYLEN